MEGDWAGGEYGWDEVHPGHWITRLAGGTLLKIDCVSASKWDVYNGSEFVGRCDSMSAAKAECLRLARVILSETMSACFYALSQLPPEVR